MRTVVEHEDRHGNHGGLSVGGAAVTSSRRSRNFWLARTRGTLVGFTADVEA